METREEAKKNNSKTYRTWMYKLQDNKVIAEIFNIGDAEEAFDKGWLMTPADLCPDKEMRDHPDFITGADKIALDANFLLNVDKCKDKKAIANYAKEYLDLELDEKRSVLHLRSALKKEAIKKGLLEK